MPVQSGSEAKSRTLLVAGAGAERAGIVGETIAATPTQAAAKARLARKRFPSVLALIPQ
jgi:hypothetical protein